MTLYKIKIKTQIAYFLPAYGGTEYTYHSKGVKGIRVRSSGPKPDLSPAEPTKFFIYTSNVNAFFRMLIQTLIQPPLWQP